MARKFTGVINEYICCVPQKNGDIYVYRRRSQYNQEKGYMVTLSNVLIGKKVKGVDPIVPTRPKKSKKGKGEEHNTSIVQADKKAIGATAILELIGNKSGIDNNLKSITDEGTAKKIITIARFWLANPKMQLSRIKKWQFLHPNPYNEPISRDVYLRLFSDIGNDEQLRFNYFRCRASLCATKDDYLAYDSTTVSTYSENLKFARQGFNKDKDGNDTIKLLTFYSIKARQPILFEKLPGNIPDVSSVRSGIKKVQWLGYKGVQVVTDNGYYSEKNIVAYIRNNIKFLTLIETNTKWIANLLEEHRDELETFSSVYPGDRVTHCITVQVNKSLTWERERNIKEHRIGDKEKINCMLYVHLYLNRDNIARDEKKLISRIMDIKELLESGQNEFTDTAENLISRFFIVEGRGTSSCKAIVKEETFAQAKKNYGYFALLSNKKQDAFEALKTYRLREKIEECYHVHKELLDGSTPRVWYDVNFTGRTFCQFVALGYWCYFRNAVSDMKELLRKEEPTLGVKEKQLRKNLLNWLEKNSLSEILDWFDCIELTHLKTDGKSTYIRSDTTERDRLFILLLKQIISSN